MYNSRNTEPTNADMGAQGQAPQHNGRVAPPVPSREGRPTLPSARQDAANVNGPRQRRELPPLPTGGFLPKAAFIAPQPIRDNASDRAQLENSFLPMPPRRGNGANAPHNAQYANVPQPAQYANVPQTVQTVEGPSTIGVPESQTVSRSQQGNYGSIIPAQSMEDDANVGVRLSGAYGVPKRVSSPTVEIEKQQRFGANAREQRNLPANGDVATGPFVVGSNENWIQKNAASDELVHYAKNDLSQSARQLIESSLVHGTPMSVSTENNALAVRRAPVQKR